MSTGGEGARTRLDKWLWGARFFKTRSLAAQAISRERVRVDGQTARPSRAVRIGDEISIDKPPFRQVVQVIGLDDGRGTALEAATRFVETADSVAERQRVAERLRAERRTRLGEMPTGRPDRRARRQLKQWRRTTAPDTDGHEEAATPERREDC